MNPYENNSHTKSTPQNFQTRSHEHTGKIQNWAVQLQQTETLLYSRISKDQREATHRLGENTCKLNIWHEANVQNIRNAEVKEKKSNKNWAVDLNMYFSNEGTLVANRYIKKNAQHLLLRKSPQKSTHLRKNGLCLIYLHFCYYFHFYKH